MAVQSLQLPPRLPHDVLLDFMHVPPWQQPVKQLNVLQLPPPEPPLDDPEDDPLDDPLDDPEDDPLDDPDVSAHDPPWQTWLLAVQSTHETPCRPHAELSVPFVQLPLESQQPLQIAAQPLLSSPEPLASSLMTVLPLLLPLPLPPLLLPPLLLLPLLFRPGPLDEGAAAASEAPASCIGCDATGCGKSPSRAVDPVAHAARTTSTNPTNCTALRFIEPMRPRPPTRSRPTPL